MGLLCTVDMIAMGFPDVLEAMAADNSLVSVEVEYGEALEAFVDTFISSATSYVPVDTGYLQSTIDGECDDYTAEVWADAEYAQYVEFGTWKMAAQPYFTPAVEEAWQVCLGIASDILNEAQEELQDILEEIQEAVMAEMAEIGGEMEFGEFGNFMLGMLATVLVMIVMFPILVNIYGILDTLSGGSQKSGRGGYGGGGPEIEIT